MRGMVWICVLLVCFSEAWSLDPVRSAFTFDAGSQVNLTCSKTMSNRTIYVIWRVKLKNKECYISIENNQTVDKCLDGKSLQHSNLLIPNFSTEDVGVYKCEFVYSGGKEDHIIDLSIIVPPQTHAWLESKNNKMVAVCKAERGNPAANISWSHTGNVLSYEALPQADGFVTVESRLELPEDTDVGNLSCAVSHPSWVQARIVMPQAENANFPWLYIVIAVVIVTAIFVGSASFALKAWRRSRQADVPPSKLPPTEYVEEVEPYASYVQRVNSIYNSSADLFT
ncbi:cell surface glycoprotein CD200 receptor 1 isoform X2 [Salarias fasciatus]|uniref:Cell surface glycoprotein CD200 receptor 1-like n=1 Tax=Salarias fasciatus TaxID=181472 RepID=A0A672GZ10_SALFA|nr:cell surface glycoprotein CD200 receptor 1-like isoform X2 [Salarias fasciatus]